MSMESDGMRTSAILLLAAVVILFMPSSTCARDVIVRDSDELRSALDKAKPGTTIKLMPGEYRGGIFLSGANGREDAPITICGSDREEPPVFTGGNQALHLSDSNHIVISNDSRDSGTAASRPAVRASSLVVAYP